MNPSVWLHDPAACVELVARLVAVSAACSATESLVARRVFVDDALLGWPLLRKRSRLAGDGPVARMLGALFEERGILWLHGARLLAAVLLFGMVQADLVRSASLFVLFVAQCFLHLRQFGVAIIGGDRMRMLILGALTLRELAPESALVAKAAVWFIAGQCALAYATSGLLKWQRTLEWRNGTAVGLLLGNEFLGHTGLAAWLTAHPAMNRVATWGVLALEVLFPLALLGGTPVAVVFVAGAFLMHLGIGHFMGLAPFLWAFLASYPAVLFVSAQVRGWLGW